ncbi:MAG: DNA-binding MarR family transcriptional regulator [Glaciecola sp.]|jgi:DNA-binding MarR family transcriptional regulator
MTSITADQLHAWRAFLESHAALIELLTIELDRSHDLPLTWYDVLVNLSEADDHRLRMQELAAGIVLSKSGLTRLVQRMQDAGLVQREPCPGDRRGVFAVMTAAGYARLREAAPAHIDGVARHFAANLTDQEVRVLGVALTKVKAAASNATA